MASGNYPACIKFVLQWEGGKVDDPQDPGGRTNQGVTQATYNGWRRARGLPVRDVYDMADDERDQIYRRDYWDKIGGDNLPAGVDLATFDVAVNSGPKKGLYFLGRALVGDPSPETIALRICEDRMDFLRRLSTWARFGKGWTRRVDACRAKAVNMARAAVDEPKIQEPPAPVEPVEPAPAPEPVAEEPATEPVTEPSLKDLVADWLAKSAAFEDACAAANVASKEAAVALERIKAEMAK